MLLLDLPNPLELELEDLLMERFALDEPKDFFMLSPSLSGFFLFSNDAQ